MRNHAGFTLIELMIVVTLIAILAMIAVPNLLSSRVLANETSAIATLRNLSSAQSQFVASAVVDADGDGTGEYGVLRELSAGVSLRTSSNGAGSKALNVAILPGGFRTLNSNAEVSRSGYLFKMFLPATGGAAVEETAAAVGDSLAGTVSDDLAETVWAAYGWPSTHSSTGNRSFFVNQRGDVTRTESTSYSGPGSFDTANAGSAFTSGGGALTSITGEAAVGTVGRDANTWTRVD